MAIVTAQRTLCLLILLAVALLLGISTTASTTPSVGRAVGIVLHDVQKLRAEVEALELHGTGGTAAPAPRLVTAGAQPADAWQAAAMLARSSREGLGRLAVVLDRAGDRAGTDKAVGLLGHLAVIEQKLQGLRAVDGTIAKRATHRQIERDLARIDLQIAALDPTRRKFALADF